MCGNIQTGEDGWSEVSGCQSIDNYNGMCTLSGLEPGGSGPLFVALSAPVTCADTGGMLTCGPCGTQYHVCQGQICDSSTGGCIG